MHTYQHTAFTVLDKCDILYVGHKSNDGIGLGRRRRLIWISLLHNVVKRVLNRIVHSVVISVVQTLTEFERIG